MYSISVAHANDNAKGRFMQIASGMLIANASGSVVGPLLYSGLQVAGVRNGFMLPICFAFAGCIIWTSIRLRTHKVQREYYEPFQALPKTSVEAAMLHEHMHADGEISAAEGEVAEPAR